MSMVLVFVLKRSISKSIRLVFEKNDLPHLVLRPTLKPVVPWVPMITSHGERCEPFYEVKIQDFRGLAKLICP